MMLILGFLGSPLQTLYYAQELVDLLSQLSEYGVLASVLERMKNTLWLEVEAHCSSEDVFGQVVGPVIHSLKDHSLEEALVAFKSVLNIGAELGSLKDGERCLPMEEVVGEHFPQAKQEPVTRGIGNWEVSFVSEQKLPIGEV